MRIVTAYVVSFAVAAAVPIVAVCLFLLIVLLLGERIGIFGEIVLGTTALLSVAAVALAGVPITLLLHHFHRTSWRLLAVGGFLAGAVPYLLYLLWFHGGGEFDVPLRPISVLMGSLFFGAWGTICSSSFWLVFRRAMRPNNALERERGR